MDELYFMEYMMENIAIFTPIVSLLQILSLVFVVLYMNYTAKYKNHDLSVAWYILAFFFPVPVAIAFAIKSKNFRHENTKVCSQCGDKYPETFSMCSRCLIDLPELDDPSRMKKKKLGRIFCVLFWIVTVATVVTFGFLCSTVFEQTMDMLEYEESLNYSYRIGITDENGETAYYDKEGKAYADPNEVVIYGRDGEVYQFTVKEIENDSIDGTYEETFYVDENGKEYDSYLCYVDEEGYFYFDEDEEIFYDEANYEEFFGDSEDYIDEETYRYYYDRYIDDDGNIFYWAEEVSWNEKGEIITAENDPNPPVIKKAE